jgi:hypothetical protein
LLNFSAETFYIGQAIDIVRRFSQHRKNYNNIVKFCFQPFRKGKLNEIWVKELEFPQYWLKIRVKYRVVAGLAIFYTARELFSIL